MTAGKPPLPQQRLLLELLHMSGDIGVTRPPDRSVLWRTLHECEGLRWITVAKVSQSVHVASITPQGRVIALDGIN